MDTKTSTLRRRVVENPDLISMPNSNKNSSPSRSPLSNSQGKSPMSETMSSKDPELLSIHSVLKQLEKDFGKGNDEIADIFVRVSGRLDKMKDYLEGRPVLEWNMLEDMALEKPEESPEF